MGLDHVGLVEVGGSVGDDGTGAGVEVAPDIVDSRSVGAGVGVGLEGDTGHNWSCIVLEAKPVVASGKGVLEGDCRGSSASFENDRVIVEKKIGGLHAEEFKVTTMSDRMPDCDCANFFKEDEVVEERRGT